LQRFRNFSLPPAGGKSVRVCDTLTGMKGVLKWVFGILGALVLAAAPYLLHVSMSLFWLAVLIVCAWAFWLMLEYLRWAKSLGRK
jgi:hypothetical protein